MNLPKETSRPTISLYRIPEDRVWGPPEKLVLIIEAEGQAYGLEISGSDWSALILGVGTKIEAKVIDGTTQESPNQADTPPEKHLSRFHDPNFDLGPGTA